MVSGTSIVAWTCGTSLPSTTNTPSWLNGWVPVWNCGIVIVPDR